MENSHETDVDWVDQAKRDEVAKRLAGLYSERAQKEEALRVEHVKHKEIVSQITADISEINEIIKAFNMMTEPACGNTG